MKKTVITILAGFMTFYGYAQSAFDAYKFSENDYEGSARTVAMGNAFTALGGDLGSIGINPAGSAVAGYSQITITPGLTFTAATSHGVPPYQGSTQEYFEHRMRSSITNFSLPDIGVSVNFKTNRTSGLKNFTFGFVMNQTANYNEDVYAKGTNSTTSFMGSMAYYAYGLTGAYLDSDNAFDFYEDWGAAIGYRSGMISTAYSKDGNIMLDPDGNEIFVGASQYVEESGNGTPDIIQAGALKQAFGRKIKGGKYDYVINFGANFSDFIYVGANLGISSTEYSYRDYFKEDAIDPEEFKMTILNDDGTETETAFTGMKYKYSSSSSGIGYYGKFGVIITPGAGFRIGAAVQTPTINMITDNYEESGETSYTDSRYGGYAESPYGEYRYQMISPLRANFGLAYTIGKFGVVSADYEICNYGSMRYKISADEDRDYIDRINDEIAASYKTQHMFRLGAEIKPLPGLAVRAGYGLISSAEANPVSPLKTQNLSLGIGYSSAKSFFADLAVRKVFQRKDFCMPYKDYVYETDQDGYLIVDANDNPIVVDGNFAPEIGIDKSTWKVLLTLGWRF